MKIERRFGESPDELSMAAALGKYCAVIRAVFDYFSLKKEVTIACEDPFNIYEAKCARRLQFAFGQARQFRITRDGQPVCRIDARLEAKRFGECFGDFTLDIDAKDQSLLERLTASEKEAAPLNPKEMSEAIAGFLDGYQHCYGHCRRE